MPFNMGSVEIVRKIPGATISVKTNAGKGASEADPATVNTRESVAPAEKTIFRMPERAQAQEYQPSRWLDALPSASEWEQEFEQGGEFAREGRDGELPSPLTKLTKEEHNALKTVGKSPTLRVLLVAMTEERGMSSDAMRKTLDSARKDELEATTEAFRTLHHAADRLLDDKVGISVSEFLRFRRALDKAAKQSINAGEAQRSPSSPLQTPTQPSGLVRLVARIEGLDVNAKDLGPGFIQDLQREVERGNIPRRVADAIQIVYGSPVISRAAVAAHAQKDMSEDQLAALVASISNKQDVADAAWALNTLQRYGDEELEKTFGVSISEVLALRDVLYDYKAEKAGTSPTVGEEGQVSEDSQVRGDQQVVADDEQVVEEPAAEESKSVTEEPWFWPAVVGAIVVGLLVLVLVVVGATRKSGGSGGGTSAGGGGGAAATTVQQGT